MKGYFFGCRRKPLSIFIFLVALSINNTEILKAEDSFLREMQIESSTKSDEEKSGLPTNPFEIVEMIRRANSLNDATIPSDAINDALKSFKDSNEKENL